MSAEIERRASVEPHLLERVAPWQRASEIAGFSESAWDGGRFGWSGLPPSHGLDHRFDAMKHPARGLVR